MKNRRNNYKRSTIIDTLSFEKVSWNLPVQLHIAHSSHSIHLQNLEFILGGVHSVEFLFISSVKCNWFLYWKSSHSQFINLKCILQHSIRNELNNGKLFWEFIYITLNNTKKFYQVKWLSHESHLKRTTVGMTHGEKERKTMMKTQNQYSCNCFLIQCSLRIFYLFITVGHGLKEWREFIWMNCNHHETVENEKKEHGILTPKKKT